MSKLSYCYWRNFIYRVYFGTIGNVVYLEIFFPVARVFIGYFEVTWHLTMKTVSRQNLWKSLMSEGSSALLPANVDRLPPLLRGLINSQLKNFPRILIVIPMKQN